MVIARCEKCGQEYQLEPGEKPEDFQCECGGELIDSKIPKEPEENSNESENTITCPHCGAENPEDSKLCKSCKRFIIPIKTSPTDKTSPSQPQSGKSKDGILETWNKQSTPIKAVSILGFCVVLIFLIVGITGMLNPSQTIVQTPATTTSNNTSTSQVQATWHNVANFNSSDLRNGDTPTFSIKGNQFKVIIEATSGTLDKYVSSVDFSVNHEGKSDSVSSGKLNNFKSNTEKREFDIYTNPGNYYLHVTSANVGSLKIQIVDYS